MHRTIRLAALALLFIASDFGDTLRFRDGRSITGTWLGGDARTVVFEASGRQQRIPIPQVESITISEAPATPEQATPAAPIAPAETAPGPAAAPPPTISANQALVAGVAGGLAYIGKGSRAGFKVGQVFQVFRMITVPLTDDNGNPLTRRKPICILTLSDVQEESANGKCAGETPARLDIAELRTQTSLTPPAQKMPEIQNLSADAMRVNPQEIDRCDASGELSDSCAEAYTAYGVALKVDAQAEPFFRKALQIRERGPHTDQSLALALELEVHSLNPAPSFPESRDFQARAVALRKKAVHELNSSITGTPDAGARCGAPVEIRPRSLDDPLASLEVGACSGAPVLRARNGVSQPTVISKVDPPYTEVARFLKWSCSVLLSLVVETDGRPTTVTLLRGCGFGLDEQAARAVLQWRFRPGMKECPCASRLRSRSILDCCSPRRIATAKYLALGDVKDEGANGKGEFLPTRRTCLLNTP
jgi:TonB family protein